MITEKDLQEAIAECQGTRNPNSNTCIKLAAYYTLMDHLYGKAEEKEIPSYSYANDNESNVTYNSDSEFSHVIYGRNVNDILPVIDELMDTLQIINPKLYNGVLNKLEYM